MQLDKKQLIRLLVSSDSTSLSKYGTTQTKTLRDTSVH